MIEHVNPPGLYPGAPYHYAASPDGGRMVFAAGACPIDEDGVVVPGGIEAQAAEGGREPVRGPVGGRRRRPRTS